MWHHTWQIRNVYTLRGCTYFFNTRIYAYIRWRYVKVNAPKRNGCKKNLDRKEVLFFIMAGKALKCPELKTSLCDRTNRSVTQSDKVCLVLVCVWRQHVEPQVWQHASSSQERDSSNSPVAFRVSKLLRTKIEDEDTKLSCLPWAFESIEFLRRRSRQSWSYRVVLYVSKWWADAGSEFMFWYQNIYPHLGIPKNVTTRV